MFRVVTHNDSGGMHIKILRQEKLAVPKEEVSTFVKLFGVKRSKGELKEVIKEEKKGNSLTHVCEICNKEFEKEVGLKIHMMRKHK